MTGTNDGDGGLKSGPSSYKAMQHIQAKRMFVVYSFEGHDNVLESLYFGTKNFHVIDYERSTRYEFPYSDGVVNGRHPRRDIALGNAQEIYEELKEYDPAPESLFMPSRVDINSDYYYFLLTGRHPYKE